MYKHRGQALQRRYKVHEIDFTPQGHVESDFIPSAENLSYEECQDERRNVLLEKARAENELVAIKACRDWRQADVIGLRLAGYSTRLSLLNKRIKHLAQIRSVEVNNKTFYAAIKEIVPAEMLERIYARTAELREELLEAERPTWVDKADTRLSMKQAAE